MAALHELGNGTPSLVALRSSTRICQKTSLQISAMTLMYSHSCLQAGSNGKERSRGGDDAPGTEAGSDHGA